MTEVIFCIAAFVLVFAIFLKYNQTRKIRNEQNLMIETLRGEARFLLKEYKRDKEMLNWADRTGHYDVRCESLRDELRSAMEEDNA